VAPNAAAEFSVNAILCDSATTAEGKLYVQGGGWSMLGTTLFPFQQPRISLGIVVAVPYTATNQNHTLRIYLVGEDGQRISFGGASTEQPDGEVPGSIEARFNLGRPPTIQPGDAQTIPMAVNLDQLRFDAPGAYSFVIEIDGTEVERLIFRVTLPVGLALAAS
jgi:hypothetical protein